MDILAAVEVLLAAAVERRVTGSRQNVPAAPCHRRTHIHATRVSCSELEARPDSEEAPERAEADRREREEVAAPQQRHVAADHRAYGQPDPHPGLSRHGALPLVSSI